MATLAADVPARDVARAHADRRPVVGWAVAGSLFLLVEAYGFIHWIASGQAHRTSTGPDPIPTAMKVEAHAFEAVAWIASIGIIWFLIVRPWRRGVPVMTDVVLLGVCATLFWLDPLWVYRHHWANYSGAFVNLGSWAQLPGSSDPTAHAFPEALIFASALYLAMVFGGVAAGCWFMRLAARRFPAWPRTAVALSGLAFLFAVDVVLEGLVFVRLGLYVMPGAYGPMINRGHYYQFPLLYGICVSVTWWAWALVRYFRDDRGLTVAERGLDVVAPSGRKRTAVRFLALAGFMNVLGFALFVIPMNLISLHQHPWPADFQHRSYLWGGACTVAADCPFEP